jgi:MFS family permease
LAKSQHRFKDDRAGKRCGFDRPTGGLRLAAACVSQERLVFHLEKQRQNAAAEDAVRPVLPKVWHCGDGSRIDTNTAAIQRESWTPMIAIALGQVLLAFNTASLPVALSGLVKTFGVPPTTVAASIVMYSLAVAGFVMLGAKLNQRFGAVRVFRAVVILFGVAQALMTFSPNATAMIVAQGLCGVAGAALVPSLVMLVADKYRGEQQAAALGVLGAAGAGAAVAAFMIGGILGTYFGWRPAFGILMVLAFVVFMLSLRFAADRGHPKSRSILWGSFLRQRRSS